MRIFLSSTYRDLITIRAAAIHYLEGIMGTACDSTGKIVAMEFFSASDCSCKEECLQELSTCDLVVGIYGQKYGAIDKESGFSMTEIEFDYAVKKGITILAFVQKEFNRDEKEKTFISQKIYGRDIICANFECENDFISRLDESLKKYLGYLDGYSFHSLWSEVDFLRESVQREIDGNTPGAELKVIPYTSGQEAIALDSILDSASKLQLLHDSLCKENEAVYSYAYDSQFYPERINITTQHELINKVEANSSYILRNWEVLYQGLPNHIMHISLAAMYLKLARMQHRLLTEQWTEDLRQDVLKIRSEYVNLARVSRYMD